MTPIQIIDTILLIFNGALFIMSGYLVILTLAAYRARPPQTPPPNQPLRQFQILIPAHNEAQLLPQLLTSIAQLDYPTHLYTTHVIADNCSDETAAVARRQGAAVHEREDTRNRGKGHALNWLIAQLKGAGSTADAQIVLDADTIISGNFLRVINTHLQRGESVIQAYYSVRHPEQSYTIALRYAALALLHHLRPLGRTSLGASAGLKGNGMVFARGLLNAHPWTGHLTEDIHLHMDLLLAGHRVTYAPQAIVWAEMPRTLRAAATQNARWETGRLQMARRYVPRLLAQAATAARRRHWRQAYLHIDAALEHIIPPFSLLAAGSACGLLLSLLLHQPRLLQEGTPSLHQPALPSPLAIHNIYLAAGALLAQTIYFSAGLHLARPPRAVYRSLLYAPLFVVWKCVQHLRIVLRKGQPAWIRTARNLDKT